MDGKIIVYGFCLLFIIAGTTFWTYTMDIDEAQKDVVLARQQAVAIEDSIKQSHGWMAARKEAAAFISAASIIEQQNETLRTEVNAIKQQRSDLAKAFIASIERAREETLGKVMPEITLATGTTLKQASIQSVDPEITVFQHSEGVSKVPTTILPSTLLDRLRFGYKPDGIGVGPSVVDQVSGGPAASYTVAPARSLTSSISTAASDSLTRLGMNSSISTRDGKKKKALPAPRDPNRIKIEGDPALWKSVERSSIGRAYIPGQGWLKVGADGPIPGSARKP